MKEINKLEPLDMDAEVREENVILDGGNIYTKEGEVSIQREEFKVDFYGLGIMSDIEFLTFLNQFENKEDFQAIKLEVEELKLNSLLHYIQNKIDEKY